MTIVKDKPIKIIIFESIAIIDNRIHEDIYRRLGTKSDFRTIYASQLHKLFLRRINGS